MPATAVDPLHVLFSLISTIYEASTIYSHFVDEETESQDLAPGHIAN